MGQYFRPVFFEPTERAPRITKFYNPHHFMNGAKQVESAYMGNDMYNAIERDLINNPQHFASAGDYNSQEKWARNGANLYDLTKTKANSKKAANPDTSDMSDLPTGMYVLNHTKREFYSRDKIIKDYSLGGMCYNPLALMCADSCEGGNGDYEGAGEKNVGRWARDLIEIVSDKAVIPDNYVEIDPGFKPEKWWAD